MNRNHETHAFTILEYLNVAGQQSFTELKELLGTRSNATAYALRTLMSKDGPLVIRDQKTRKYEITDKGKFMLRNEQVGRAIKSGKRKGQQKEGYYYAAVELEHIEPVLEPFDKMPFELGLIGDTSLDYDRLGEKIKRTLEYIPNVLMREFAEEMAWQKGVEEPKEMKWLENYYTKRLSYIKEAYDFEITMLLHFNPRRLIRLISWKDMLQDAREKDAKIEEKHKIVQKISLKDLKLDKEKMLGEYAESSLRTTALKGNIFKMMAEPMLRNPEGSIASSENQLIDKIVNNIKAWRPFAKPLLKDHEIEAALRRRLGKDYRIVQQTIFLVEKVASDVTNP